MCIRFFEVGDHVRIEVTDRKKWTFAARHDGPVEAVIKGFGKTYVGRVNNGGLIPGCYLDRKQIMLEVGSTTYTINGAPDIKVRHLDPQKASDRLDYFSQAVGCCNGLQKRDHVCQEDYLGPLPATKCWEGDLVNVGGKTYTVLAIDYRNAVCGTGSCNPYTLYYLGDDLYHSGQVIERYALDLILNGHGPIRRFAEGWPLEFDCVDDEAIFHRLIGNYRSVSEDQNSGWSVTKLIDALEGGIVHHAWINSLDRKGQTWVEDPVWLYDEPVGQRIAQQLLAEAKSLAIV